MTVIKSKESMVDNSSTRSNFMKSKPRNFHLQVDPLSVGISRIIDSAVQVVSSDTRYAKLWNRLFSQTFLRGFDNREIADYVGSGVCGRINSVHPEAKADYLIVQDRDTPEKTTIVIRTKLFNS